MKSIISRLPKISNISIQYDHQELWLQRLLLSLIVLSIGFRAVNFTEQPFPNGLAHYIDFTFLANPSINLILRGLLVIATIIYVWGRFMPLSVGYMLSYLVALGTLKNSQGAIGHGTQIVTLILLGQFCGYCYSHCLRLFRQNRDIESKQINHYVAINWTNQTIAAAYVVAGLVKIQNSGISWHWGLPIPNWIINLPRIAVEIIKSHSQQYYTNLDSDMLERGTIIANYIVNHPNLTRIIFSGGLFLELFAFLALLGRKWSLFIGGSLILMHIGIDQIMALMFINNIYVLLIFWVNLPFLLILITKKCKPLKR